MKKLSGGFIGYNTPRFGSGISPDGVYNHQDVIDLRKSTQYPRDSAAATGWPEMSSSGPVSDPYYSQVHWGMGDCEFPDGSCTDETGGWTEQFEWFNQYQVDQNQGRVVNSFFHPANRFFSRRFSTSRGSYMTVAHNDMFNYGTGQFTLEFWFKRTDVMGEQHYIISKGTGSTGWSCYINTSYQIVMEIAGTTTATTLPSAGVNGYHAGFQKDQWYHVAIVRTNVNDTRIYVNGRVQATAAALSGSMSTTEPMYVGADKALTGGATRGSHAIADLRLSNTAIYSGNFACPANVLSVTTNTNFFMPMDGEPYGPWDATSNAAPGGANVTVSFYTMLDSDTPIAHTRPANIASVFFYSNADYLTTVTPNLEHNVGSGEFTYETWFYSTTYGQNTTPIFVTSNATTAAHEIGIYQNYNGAGLTISFPNNAGSSTTYVSGIGDEPRGPNTQYWGNTVSTGRWHHAAITRDTSNNLRFFLDGNLKFSNAAITFNQSSAMHVWLNSSSTAGVGMHNAWINSPRIANVCLYTSNFIPDTTVAPDLTGNTRFALRGNVQLEWATSAGRNANAGTTIALTNYVSGRISSLCRYDGNFTPWTADPLQAQVPSYVYDTARVERNGIFSYQRLASTENMMGGPGNYGAIYQSLKSSDTSLQFGTGAFTFEAWVYPVGNTEVGKFFGLGNHQSTGFALGYGLRNDNSGTPTPKCLVFEHAGIEVTSDYMPLQLYKWNHVAVVRESTATEKTWLFVNGYLAHRFTCVSNITAASNPLYIFQGRSPSSSYQNAFKGKMAMLRFSNSARYNGGSSTLGSRAFTPSFTPYDSDANTKLLLFQYAWPSGQDGMLDLGSHKMNVRQGDYKYGGSTAWSPADQVNWSYVNGQIAADLAIWSVDTNGVAQSAPGVSTDFTFGTNDFSIEFFYKPWRHLDAWSDIKEPFWYGPDASYPDGAQLSIIKDVKGNLVVTYGAGNNQYNMIQASSRTRLWEPDQWYHVVVQRTSGQMAVYINGLREQEVRFTTNLGAATPDSNLKILGGSGNRQGQFSNTVQGYVSNFRVFNGKSAYGQNGYNPLNIPIPTSPLSGEDSACKFLAFCGPSLRDYSRGNKYWQYGGHKIVWSAWERANDGSRSGYKIAPFGPFPEPVKHWRNHTFRMHSYQYSDIYIGDVDQTENIATHRTSWIGGQQLPFTIEMWFYAQESRNNDSLGSTILNTWVLSHSSDLASDRSAFHMRYHATNSNGNQYGNMFFGLQGSGTAAGVGGGRDQSFIAASYHHCIFQYDPSATGAQKYVGWVNGYKTSNQDNSATFQNRSWMYNWMRGVGIANLRISNCARYNPFQMRLDEPAFGILRKGVNDYFRIDKHTAVLPVNISSFKKMGWTPGQQGIQGVAAVSKVATNSSKLAGSKATLFFGQNSSQSSGGYWGASTPPWGNFSAPTNFYHWIDNEPGGNFNGKNDTYQDWTFECWFSWAGASSPNDKFLFEYANNWSFRIISNNIYFRTSNSDTYQRSLGVALASSSSNRVFQHMVLQRKNAGFEMFIDGQWVTSFPASYWPSDWGVADSNWWSENTTSWNWSIGKDQSDAQSTCWLGNIQDPRFTYGFARYDRGIVNGQECMVLRNTNTPVLAIPSLGINDGVYNAPFLSGQYSSN